MLIGSFLIVSVISKPEMTRIGGITHMRNPLLQGNYLVGMSEKLSEAVDKGLKAKFYHWLFSEVTHDYVFVKRCAVCMGNCFYIPKGPSKKCLLPYLS
jgi:hypothetical protein